MADQQESLSLSVLTERITDNPPVAGVFIRRRPERFRCLDTRALNLVDE
jgi:hypothetical protein